MTIDSGNTFTCWKEIASYLGKGVRTVQRWERQFGLPVQRPNARNKGIVRASRDELDIWMKTQWSRRAAMATNPAPPSFHANSALESAARLRELRASNHELLQQFKESLRVLNAQCEELREAVCQQAPKDEKNESAVA